MRLRFWKLCAGGNDFVLIHDAKNIASRTHPRFLEQAAALSRILCRRRTGIGADGMLLIGGKRPPYGVDYFNCDGSQAFCGNGARCAAWWLYQERKVRAKSFRLRAGREVLAVEVLRQERVRVSMPRPHGIRLNVPVSVRGKIWRVHLIDTGVPHAVVNVPSVEDFPVERVGRAIRSHHLFSPEGCNVDFCALRQGELQVRTFERGVEAETCSCGTGLTAAALIRCVLKPRRSPVRVYSRSGDQFSVGFSFKNSEFFDVSLEGPARIVFQGEVNV